MEQEHNEIELRKEWMAEARKQTLDTLPAFLKKLSEFPHDYGTICRAIAAAAIGAAWAVESSPGGGITGFQAGCVMWDFIVGWSTQYEGHPVRLVDYDQMLYPQYSNRFDKVISKETWEYLQGEARRLIRDTKEGSVEVLAHWHSVAEGVVPFGYVVDHGQD